MPGGSVPAWGCLHRKPKGTIAVWGAEAARCKHTALGEGIWQDMFGAMRVPDLDGQERVRLGDATAEVVLRIGLTPEDRGDAHVEGDEFGVEEPNDDKRVKSMRFGPVVGLHGRRRPFG